MSVTLTDTPTETADTPSSEAPTTGSLKPVIDIIPAEAYDNPTWRGLAYFARDLVVYGLVVTALIVVSNPLGGLLLQIPAALAITALFIVGHDAAHGALFESKWLNSFVGHVVMLPSWHVYEGWVLGHNRIHHAYTVRQGYDFVWHPYTAEEYAAMSPLAKLRHRFEWSWVGAGAYYIREVWWKKMIVGQPPARWRSAIRRDRLVVLGFVAGSAALLGWLGWTIDGGVWGATWMVLRVLVLPFLGFSFMIGSLVHVHHIQPDIRWWPRREWTKFKGQMEGTTILRAPKGLDFFFHWIMIHIPHHVDMRIPMYRLELAAAAIKAHYPETVHDDKLRFRDFVANSRQCKLYDFEAGTWLTYREAAERTVEPAPAP